MIVREAARNAQLIPISFQRKNKIKILGKCILERKRSLICHVSAWHRERASKAMTHSDYDNNFTYIPGSADSFAEPRQHDRHPPVTRGSSAIAGRIQRIGQRERALLTRLSKFLAVGGTGVLVNSLTLL